MTSTSRLTSAAPTDPLENAVASALEGAGIAFVRDWDGALRVPLDFYLPEHDVFLEVKRFHSDRIAAQMSRAENVMVLQGEPAVRWFCDLLARKN